MFVMSSKHIASQLLANRRFSLGHVTSVDQSEPRTGRSGPAAAVDTKTQHGEELIIVIQSISEIICDWNSPMIVIQFRWSRSILWTVKRTVRMSQSSLKAALLHEEEASVSLAATAPMRSSQQPIGGQLQVT